MSVVYICIYLEAKPSKQLYLLQEKKERSEVVIIKNQCKRRAREDLRGEPSLFKLDGDDTSSLRCHTGVILTPVRK